MFSLFPALRIPRLVLALACVGNMSSAQTPVSVCVCGIGCVGGEKILKVYSGEGEKKSR